MLLAAARAEFTERGYEGATVRAIAGRAGVDAAMVNHWFGSKDALFVAAMEIPVNPDEIVPRILDGDPALVGERIVRTFLTVWDANGGGALAALMRSVASHESAARMLREFVARIIIGRIVAAVAPDSVELRAALCGTQVAGLGMVRYVIRLEPLASADHDTVVSAIAPNLQRYLTYRRGSASKQVRSPVWQAAPCWSTTRSTASPSQSSRTSWTSWVCPDVSPLTQYSPRLRDQYVARRVVRVRCSASSSIHATISTSPVPRCCATAQTSPSAVRVSRSAITGLSPLTGPSPRRCAARP